MFDHLNHLDAHCTTKQTKGNTILECYEFQTKWDTFFDDTKSTINIFVCASIFPGNDNVSNNFTLLNCMFEDIEGNEYAGIYTLTIVINMIYAKLFIYKLVEGRNYVKPT